MVDSIIVYKDWFHIQVLCLTQIIKAYIKLIGITSKKYIETIHMDNTYRLYKLIWLYKCIGVIHWVKNI